MANRINWTTRKFEFHFSVYLYPEIIERFRGTPARAAFMISGYPTDILTAREGDTWSIQENIGHLLDLESLVMRRVSEYEGSAPVLSAADMDNRMTNDARHNDRSITRILADFHDERAAIVRRLEGLAPVVFGRVALHPRLNQPMRLVDLIWFSCEHDDYHLARVTELARVFIDKRASP